MTDTRFSFFAHLCVYDQSYAHALSYTLLPLPNLFILDSLEQLLGITHPYDMTTADPHMLRTITTMLHAAVPVHTRMMIIISTTLTQGKNSEHVLRRTRVEERVRCA